EGEGVGRPLPPLTNRKDQAMASTPSHPAPAGQAPPPVNTIRVVSHAPLFYWWPVWFVGFLLAGLTYADGGRLAVLPPDTKVKELQPNQVYELTVPNKPTASLEGAAANTAKGQDAFPVRVARNNNYGVVYVMVVLLVTFGAN